MSKQNQVKGSPTKDFFIEMLTRDIPLDMAILELVDNSIDGATSITSDTNYKSRSIELVVNKDTFQISDNCGGIDIDVAREYAFRFGRPKENDVKAAFSVGRFGVGMKRALFKIGDHFTVVSRSVKSAFTLELDVQTWRREENWDLSFENVSEQEDNPIELTGTTILVSKLHKSISDQFGEPEYISKLKEEIKLRHERKMQLGLKITVNNEDLIPDPQHFLFSEKIKPAYYEFNFDNVLVRMFAGISKMGRPSESGWYVYCNDRLVVKADKSEITGWGVDKTPKHHPSHARFRGYVLFESNNPAKLPWNTTKTGLDLDNDMYRSIKPKMMEYIKNINSFLKALEKEDPEDKTGYQSEIKKCKLVSLNKLNISILETNVRIPVKEKKVKKEKTIKYTRLVEEIDKMQAIMGVSSAKEVGERAFEYYWEKECKDK